MLKIKECCIENEGDIPLLEMLVGFQKAKNLVHFLAMRKEGHDVLIWKSENDGKFNTKSAWDCIRV